MLRKIVYILILIVSSLEVQAAYVPDGSDHSVISYSVVDLSNQQVMSYKPNLPVHPASVMKLLTAYIAYDKLGLDFKFKTQLLKHSSSNVYALRFSGDPTLTLDRLQSLLDSEFSKPKRPKKLELIIDDVIYDAEMFAPGTPHDTQKFFYNAPISAIILNGNAVTYVYDPQKLQYVPEGRELMVRLKQNGIVKSESPLCHFNLRAVDANAYTLEGCYKNDLPPMLRMAINDPRKMVSDFLLEYFAKQGMKVDIKFQKTPDRFALVRELDSDALGNVMQDMLVYSDNIVADSIAKQIAYKVYGQQATWQLVNKAFIEYIDGNMQYDAKNLRVFDGAGQSYSNLLTTDFLVTVLKLIEKDKDKLSYFMAALPEASRDGTLKSRFESSPLKNKLRAKTGSLNYVSTLAGFFHEEGRLKAFAICINNHPGARDEIKSLEEKTLENILIY